MNALRITVNGDVRSLPPGATVSDLLESLRIGTPRVAVERNRDIVPKARYAMTPVADGDVFEVVELVGGG